MALEASVLLQERRFKGPGACRSHTSLGTQNHSNASLWRKCMPDSVHHRVLPRPGLKPQSDGLAVGDDTNDGLCRRILLVFDRGPIRFLPKHTHLHKLARRSNSFFLHATGSRPEPSPTGAGHTAPGIRDGPGRSHRGWFVSEGLGPEALLWDILKSPKPCPRPVHGRTPEVERRLLGGLRRSTTLECCRLGSHGLDCRKADRCLRNQCDLPLLRLLGRPERPRGAAFRTGYPRGVSGASRQRREEDVDPRVACRSCQIRAHLDADQLVRVWSPDLFGGELLECCSIAQGPSNSTCVTRTAM